MGAVVVVVISLLLLSQLPNRFQRYGTYAACPNYSSTPSYIHGQFHVVINRIIDSRKKEASQALL